MNLFTKQKQSHRRRKQTYGFQGGKGGEGINWEIRIDIYTLLYIKQITNKNLLYSTGNSTQYSLMTYMGIESKKDQRGGIGRVGGRRKREEIWGYMYMYS